MWEWFFNSSRFSNISIRKNAWENKVFAILIEKGNLPFDIADCVIVLNGLNITTSSSIDDSEYARFDFFKSLFGRLP